MSTIRQRQTLATLTWMVAFVGFIAFEIRANDIDQALRDMQSTDIDVRNGAVYDIAYSEDPRIPYACLPLLKDPGTSTQRIAARAIGSRFQFVKEEDISLFVKALKECLSEQDVFLRTSRDGNRELTRLLCQRAIGLLTKNYDFPEVFSQSPNGRWVIYERRSCPVIVDTLTSEHRMLPKSMKAFWQNIFPTECYWNSDSSIVSLQISRDRVTDNIWFYRVSDGRIWKLDPEETRDRLGLNIPGSNYPRSTCLNFVRWEENRAIVHLTVDSLDEDGNLKIPLETDVRFFPAKDELSLVD
jgi:hypothetical protein